MAVLPAKRFVCALAVGLALSGAALISLTPVIAGHASALTLAGAQAFEPAPPPDPVPVIDKPADPAPPAPAPTRHRRHIDGDPSLYR
jgi:hypothetical protein